MTNFAFNKTYTNMRRFFITLSIAVLSMLATDMQALPKGYEAKTARLAERLVASSMTGNYNKTYQALRNIQRYEYRLQSKEELMRFYNDIHNAVADECDRKGIDAEGKAEMKAIVDALFSDKLREEAGTL